jgi:outer membrane protein assembly factor BamB
MLVLAACGGPPPVTSWPGYTIQNNVAYLASADELVAVNLGGDIVAGTNLIGWPVKSSNPSIGYYALPAMSSDGKTLYVGTEQLNGNHGLVEAWTNVERGVQTAPTLKWSYPFTTTDPALGNLYGAIVLNDGVLYFGDGKGQVFALNAADGQPKWSAPFVTGARIWSAVAVDDEKVYAASQDHLLYAINKTSGNLVWKFPSDGSDIDALVGSPTVYEGVVYAGSFGGVLYAVDANTGKLRWSFKADGTLWDGPALDDGTLYFGDLNGNVYALDAATGQNKKWTAKVEGGVKMTPLVEDGMVYVGTDAHRMYRLNAGNGQLAWPQPYEARAGENFMVMPAIYSDTLVVQPELAGGDPVRLYGLDKNVGAFLWRYPAQKSQ